jgi:hypothetical protein
MIELGCGVFQARLDVVGLKVGIVRQDFRIGHAGRDQIEHVFDADTHSPNAGPSATLVGIEGNALHVIHPATLGTDHACGKDGIR